MRTSRSVLSTRGFGLALRHLVGGIREALLVATPIAILEQVGPYARHDGFDFAILCATALCVLLLAQASRAGWMPVTERAVLGVWAYLRSFARRLAPRYAVAFRPTADTHALPDRTLAAPTQGLAVAVVVLGALGPHTLAGLLVLKAHVSYTLYLAGLGLVWGLMFLTVLVCAVSLQQWIGGYVRRHGPSPGPYFLCLAGWLGALVGLVFVPGGVAVAILLIVGWFGARALGRIPHQGYLFCRRDAQGRPRTIQVHAYLRQVHTALVLVLALVVVLGQSERLWEAGMPAGHFKFTSFLSLIATLAGLVLTARAGAHFRRLMGGTAIPPEVPLTPTLWIKRAASLEIGSEEERREAYWYRVARESGWLVLREPEEPVHEWDLVLGEPADARHFTPRPPPDLEDARFQLERRFHVVMRRRFRRGFEALFKALRGESPDSGTGYLFCPHVWLVPGVVRDVEPRERSGASGALVGPTFFGPPYAEAFPHRVRRYIGSILRDLEIDILYMEDAVTWQDVHRVLQTTYEIHDQRRGPLQERHFMGLPRVRVVIQEEAAEPEPPQLLPRADEAGPVESAPGHARILLILRDRGQGEEDLTLDPADYGIRTPSLV